MVTLGYSKWAFPTERSDKCDLNAEEVLKEVQVTQIWEPGSER